MTVLRTALGVLAMTALTILGLIVWRAAAPTAQPIDHAAATRQYLPAAACLLTGRQGITGQPQGAAWAGMQASSLATRARVQYLPVPGGASTAPYLASLVQRRCAVILAAGQAQDATVAADAARYPGVRFITIGGLPAPRVTNIAASSASQVRASVSALLTKVLRQVMPG